jgi:hypothetical protein
VFNVSDLKECTIPETGEPPIILDVDGEVVEEMETILDSRIFGRGRSARRQYLIRFKDKGPQHDEWHDVNENHYSYWKHQRD